MNHNKVNSVKQAKEDARLLRSAEQTLNAVAPASVSQIEYLVHLANVTGFVLPSDLTGPQASELIKYLRAGDVKSAQECKAFYKICKKR